MKMISHQTKRVDLPVSFRADLAESADEAVPVKFVEDNCFPPIPSIHDVVDGTWIFDAQLASHSGKLPS